MYSRRKSKERVNLIVGGLALAGAVAAIGYMGASSIGTPTPDAFGCYDGLEQRKTSVWFDVSGPRFGPDQTRSIENFFFDELDLGLNELLSVYTSEANILSDVPKPRFYLCGIARDAGELEAAGLEPIQQGFLDRLREKQRSEILEPELGAILATDPDPARLQQYQSPVLESIAGISRAGLGPGDRLVVVSDLLQNSESARFCVVQGDMPPFALFKEKLVYRDRLLPKSLSGVDVTVLMLMRDGYGDDPLPYCNSEEELRTFFRDYFEDNGASVEFIRLRQGAGQP